MDSSPIHRLPIEVFDIIAPDLDLVTYQCLRLSSRHLYALSLSAFAKRYFSELTTSLGSDSLDRLVNVSSHGYFSRNAVLLDIKLLNHRDYKLLTKINRIGLFPPPKRFPKLASGINPTCISKDFTLYDDVFSRNYPKCIVNRLARALKNFKSLTSITFRAHHQEPLGWQTAAIPEGDQLFRTKCFQAVFDAIIKSEIQLEEFSLAKTRRTALKKCANLTYPTLQLPFSLLPAVTHCFTHLKSLTLSITAAFNGDSRVPGWENGLSHLIACAPNVKYLALSLDRNRFISHYSAAIVHSLALTCRLDNLESLHLVTCSLHEADLAALITTHADTLRQMILSDVRLLTGSWSSLFSSLLDCKELQRLRLASLEGTKSPVLFQKRNSEGLKIKLDVKKSGKTMYHQLLDLITACDTESEITENADVAE